MAADFIDFSGMEAQISALIGDLNKTVNDVGTETESAAESAALIIRNEQARLLEKANFARDKKRQHYKYVNSSMIKIMRYTKSAGRLYKLTIGYDTDTLRKYPELLVIEFGRPGSSQNRRSKTDSIGRKKGDFPPSISHIRAGFILAKDKAVNEFNERLLAIAVRDFGGNR